MNKKTLKVLEYDKIIQLLKEQATSAMAKAMVEKFRPYTDIRKIRDLVEETSQAQKAIIHKGMPPLGQIYDIEPALHLARKGGSLTMAQLLQVLYNMRVTAELRSWFRSDLPELPVLMGMAEILEVYPRLIDTIDRCILSEDEMADNASPKLLSLRKGIQRQNEAIRNRLGQIISSSDNKTYLQDAIVTMRDGRYVVPVKQEHRSRIPGIIHDQSSTGATIFIEPQVIVNLNNELRQLELEEKAEVERILYELSSKVAEHFHGLKNNQKLLIHLDVIFAKGKLSVAMGAEEPGLNEEGYILLREARHPLIDPKKVVPVNVECGRDYTTLVVTGPNTGGKTVTLKTVGLLSLMVQSGLHVPAAGTSQLPVFKNIFADIGDEQSIEQSLSTFSSHMKNIVEIVEGTGKGGFKGMPNGTLSRAKNGTADGATNGPSKGTKNGASNGTLILLDELGAGTDPTEGAALAIAILERLADAGAVTIATTHYNELKKYALSTDGVENASMEFNVETLAPTYRLVIGVPGKSNAFEISRKLGLQDQIIDRASQLIEGRDMEFEDVITAIESDRRAAEEEKGAAYALRLQVENQKKELEKQQQQLEREKEKILKAAREEARNMLQEAKETADQVQEEMRALTKVESLGQRNQRFAESRHKLREKEKQYAERVIRQVNKEEPIVASQLKIGDRVKHLTLDQNGEILSLPDDKGEVMVQIGILKLSANLKDLTLIPDSAPKKTRSKGSAGKRMASGAAGAGALYREKAMNISMSVNVQGKNMEDACFEVDKYLDDAYMAGLKEVTVIHGRGEGILKEAIRNMLKRNKHVESYRKGAYNEGGDGVTLVKLKD